MPTEAWTSGDAYDAFIGRWSGMVAREFVRWLGVSPRSRWLDVGCGTGQLTRTIVDVCEPDSVVGVDPSEAFLASARSAVDDGRASFHVGDATALPVEDASADAVVSGLVLNFVPEPARAFTELRRVVRPAGTVGGYVWDYPGRMDMLVAFWDAAVELNPDARDVDERVRFPLSDGETFRRAFERAGFVDVELRAIDVPTVFASFGDYWAPFLGGQGPAPTYLATLEPSRADALRERLRRALRPYGDGPIELVARAWAVRATAPA